MSDCFDHMADAHDDLLFGATSQGLAPKRVPAPPLRNIDMQLPRTYDQWKAEGYHVVRGQKSRARNDRGEPVFTQYQVERDR